MALGCAIGDYNENVHLLNLPFYRINLSSLCLEKADYVSVSGQAICTSSSSKLHKLTSALKQTQTWIRQPAVDVANNENVSILNRVMSTCSRVKKLTVHGSHQLLRRNINNRSHQIYRGNTNRSHQIYGGSKLALKLPCYALPWRDFITLLTALFVSMSNRVSLYPRI